MISLHCASFSRLMANTDIILFPRLDVLWMRSSPVMLQMQSHREKAVVCLYYSITWHRMYLQKYGGKLRHKPKMLLGMLPGWSRLSAEKKKGASNCLAWRGFSRNPLFPMWELAGVQSQGQSGTEGLQGRFLLCLSCSSQRDELCAQRHGHGEIVTNM